MDLGTTHSLMAIPSKPSSRPKKTYPTVTIEKPLGNYKYGDTFTATVKFRVRKIEHGKDYSDQATHRCTLELLSIDRSKSTKKGLPY